MTKNDDKCIIFGKELKGEGHKVNTYRNRIPAYLILADGTIYNGWNLGAQGTTIGEVVFTTGMTGYQETLTDPSY